MAPLSSIENTLLEAFSALGRLLEPFSLTLGEEMLRNTKTHVRCRAKLSVINGRASVRSAKNPIRSGHAEIQNKSLLPKVKRALLDAQRAVHGVPALNHPIFALDLTELRSNGNHAASLVYISVARKGFGHLPIHELSDPLVAIAKRLDGLSCSPNDPLWMVGGTAIAAPTAAQALVVQQTLARPHVGFDPANKRKMPTVSLLSNPKEVVADARRLVSRSA